MKLEQVAAFAETLPNVTVGARWNNKTWLVNERGFLWQRPLTKTDIERYGETKPPSGDIIAFITAVMTLLPGDVVATGTPAGIGALKPGDRFTVKIAGIGELSNPVIE